MRVNRIDHINLRTPIVEETAQFYEELFGLRRGRLPGMDITRNAWLYDEQDYAIVHVNMPDEGERVLEASGTGRLHHVALDCQGYDEMKTRLDDKGLDYSIGFVEQIGLRQIFVIDPNGVRLELNFRGD